MKVPETQQSILQMILDTQGPDSAHPVPDIEIAEQFDLDLQETQDHLEILEEEGKVDLIRLNGPSLLARLTARGRMALREPNHAQRSTTQTHFETHFHERVEGPVQTGPGPMYIDSLSYGVDEQALSQLRTDVIARLDAAQHQVVIAVIERLRSEQMLEVLELAATLEHSQLTEDEATRFLSGLRPALLEAEEKDILAMPAQASTMTEIVDAPSLGVAHKLKLTIPVIPFLLGYEGELQLGNKMNLEMAWEWLKRKIGRDSDSSHS